jgi:regulatory protein
MTFQRQTAGKHKQQRTYDAPALYEYAVGALGRQMRTVAELKRLMRRKVAGQQDGEQIIDQVIALLKEQRYLNDSSYAASYSAMRRDNQKFGRRRVITDLKAKGVHGDLIDQAVREAFSGMNEERQAREFLRRKRISKPENQREAARVFRTMMRAGFATKAIITVLKKWEVEDEVLSALESEAADVAESEAAPGASEEP